MINLMESINILLITGDCTILGKPLAENLDYIYTAIEITIPIIVLVLCTIDLTKAVIAQEEGEMKKAQSRAIKRIAIGLCIFFVPLLTDVILDIAGIATGVCGIGGTATSSYKSLGSGPAPALTSAKALSTSEIQINYSPSQKATGVQIKNTATGKIINSTDLKTTILKNLEDGKKYSFKVRSYYTNSEGKTTYSTWSNTKSATTKKETRPVLSASISNVSSSSTKSNCKIAEARGKQKCGVPRGDQSGKEFWVTNNKNNWVFVARLKDAKKANIAAKCMEQAAANNHIGYERCSTKRNFLGHNIHSWEEFWYAAKAKNWDVSKITTNSSTTCGPAVAVCLKAAGVKSVTTGLGCSSVGNIKRALMKTGEFTFYTSSKYTKSCSNLQRGDVLVRSLHVAMAT